MRSVRQRAALAVAWNLPELTAVQLMFMLHGTAGLGALPIYLCVLDGRADPHFLSNGRGHPTGAPPAGIINVPRSFA